MQRIAQTYAKALENPCPEPSLSIICLRIALFERIVKKAKLESGVRLGKAKGVSPVRNLGPALLLVLILASNSFAAPAVVKSSVFPEPGLLALLGGGLVGLATLIRRHLSD